MSQITLATLRQMKARGEKFASLTAYDASFARIFDAAGVEVLLVGDSLGMVFQGQESTLPVTVTEMVYHTACVRRGAQRALVMADMPFMSCANPELALMNVGRVMQEGGAHIVKIEGGAIMLDTVRLLAAHGIPICSHLGLLPQRVNKMGGYRVQGRDEASAAAILGDAQALVAAGADMLLLECVPADLAQEVSSAVEVPVIGIGAGAGCDGQVLVSYDILNITLGKTPKFAKDFLAAAGSVQGAVERYVAEVKGGTFPAEEHTFKSSVVAPPVS